MTMTFKNITDGDWTGVDPTKLYEDFVGYYSRLLSFGYANGYIS